MWLAMSLGTLIRDTLLTGLVRWVKPGSGGQYLCNHVKSVAIANTTQSVEEL